MYLKPKKNKMLKSHEYSNYLELLSQEQINGRYRLFSNTLHVDYTESSLKGSRVELDLFATSYVVFWIRI